MSKKRVEWAVRLKPSNYVRNKGELIPQVLLKHTWTLDDVIDRIVSQCTTNPTPLKEATEYTTEIPMSVTT